MEFHDAAGLQKIGEQDGHHFAVASIDYGRDFPRGWLIYIKASLTGDENVFLRHRRMKVPDFPHEGTLDQFFNEAQFESYRALGYHAAKDVLDFEADPTRNNEIRSSLLGAG